MRVSKILIGAVFAGALSLALAQSACPNHYPSGVAPVLKNPALTKQTRELCNDSFVTMYSGVTRTPLWSAEHLTRASISSAKQQKRENKFHPDERIPSSERAELSDYARSGFDRGHIAPSGDMPDPRAQEQSFALSNMIPQNPDLNRHLWEGLESSVRDMAMQRGSVYVITGPIFEGQRLDALRNRVMVPTSVFKLVYDPKRNEAAAYVAPNNSSQDYKVISISELERRTGIDFLPPLGASAKQNAMNLPDPHEHNKRGSNSFGVGVHTGGLDHEAGSVNAKSALHLGKKLFW